MTNVCLTTLFYHIDEHNKNFTKNSTAALLPTRAIGARGPERRMSPTEMMTIMIYFGFSGYRTFKDYYTRHVLIYLNQEFPCLYSYNRFVQLIPEMRPFMKTLTFATTIDNQSHKNPLPGAYFIDSFALNVCHNKRIYGHKVFKNVAKRGKTSTGWFFGFKLHVVINMLGEIVSLALSEGNITDNNERLLTQLLHGLQGKIYGDKGYIIKPEVRKKFFNLGIQFITKIRSNMKNILMHTLDKIILGYRGIIESVGNVLKNTFYLEHSRHRNIQNFSVHIFSTVCAYFFKKEKPSLPFHKFALLTA